MTELRRNYHRLETAELVAVMIAKGYFACERSRLFDALTDPSEATPECDPAIAIRQFAEAILANPEWIDSVLESLPQEWWSYREG